MRLLIATLCALALAACNQAAENGAQSEQTPPTAETGQAVVANNCPASANASWESLRLEASANGVECATAQATITIRNGAQTFWSETYPANQVMVLAGAESVDDMQRRLNEWVKPPAAALNSSGDLPRWAQGAESPANGEFPFYVEQGIDRARYEAMRGRDAPMFCYVQGMESLACLVLEDGRLTKIGVQSFPG